MIVHGIGPSVWQREDGWRPRPVGVEDVMIPSNVDLTFENLPFFAVWHGYTAEELTRLTRGPNRDPGWQMDTVNAAIKWAEEQTAKLYGGTRWSEYWSPEKAQVRKKEDSGVYASDLVQTIDCWDFYYWDDANRTEGWRRRTIFDAYGGAGSWGGVTGYGARKQLPTKNLLNEEGTFLYNSGDRVWGDRLQNIIHFQFADLSAKAPFTYHSVRSLGFMLYAVCHLQNRLRCKFAEAVFENLLMYLRVRSLDDAERVLKIELASRGIIDESVQFLSPTERWQPNPQLAELGINEYKQIIADNAASYTQNQNFSRDRVEKTKFQVMAEVNAMTTLVSAALQQAYRYAASEYREIFKRFLCPNSTDPDVQRFRAKVLKAGVPEKLLVVDAWDIEPERVVGGGNKTMEMAIAQQLMEWRPSFSPEAQQRILRSATLSITDDAAFTDALVPDSPTLSNAKHDAMLAFGSMMAGGVVRFTPDLNRLEIIETLLAELGLGVQRVVQMGGMATEPQVLGFQNVLEHISELVGQIAEDPVQKERAKKYADESGQLANQIKAFAQRIGEAKKAAAQQNGDGDGKMAETQAKIAATMAMTQAKVQANRESRAERAASREVEFEQLVEQRRREHALELEQMAERHALDLAAQTAKAEVDVEAKRRQAAEPKKAE
jgi:hypothetical protein